MCRTKISKKSAVSSKKWLEMGSDCLGHIACLTKRSSLLGFQVSSLSSLIFYEIQSGLCRPLDDVISTVHGPHGLLTEYEHGLKRLLSFHSNSD